MTKLPAIGIAAATFTAFASLAAEAAATFAEVSEAFHFASTAL